MDIESQRSKTRKLNYLVHGSGLQSILPGSHSKNPVA